VVASPGGGLGGSGVEVEEWGVTGTIGGGKEDENAGAKGTYSVGERAGRGAGFSLLRLVVCTEGRS